MAHTCIHVCAFCTIQLLSTQIHLCTYRGSVVLQYSLVFDCCQHRQRWTSELSYTTRHYFSTTIILYTISLEHSVSRYIIPCTPCWTVTALTPSFSERNKRHTGRNVEMQDHVRIYIMTAIKLIQIWNLCTWKLCSLTCCTLVDSRIGAFSDELDGYPTELSHNYIQHIK